MHEIDAWNAFFKSGSIYDYLVYKSIHNGVTEQEKTEKENEDLYRRADYKTTEYR